MSTFNSKGNNIKHHKDYSAAGWATLGKLIQSPEQDFENRDVVLNLIQYSSESICVVQDEGYGFKSDSDNLCEHLSQEPIGTKTHPL